MLLAASPDRFARQGQQLRQVLQRAARAGASVGVAAIGLHAPVPITLLELGSQHGGDAQLQQAVQQVADTVCEVVSNAAAALALEQGVYTAQHAYMSRIVAAAEQPGATASQPGGAVTAVLQVLLSQRPVAFFCRTSDEEQDGSSRACAGAAEGEARQMVTGSLQRQLAFLDKVAG
jgi:hypothetical protein